jgi:hypothetical protein
LSCPIAAFAPGFKFTTGAGSLRVDAANGLLPDFTVQRDAATRATIGAAHGNMPGGNRNGELLWHLALWVGIGFGPVKRYAKGGATGSTRDAGLAHFKIEINMNWCSPAGLSRKKDNNAGMVGIEVLQPGRKRITEAVVWRQVDNQ